MRNPVNPMNITNIAGRYFQNHCPKLANLIPISGSHGTSTYPRWIGTVFAPPLTGSTPHSTDKSLKYQVLNESDLTQTVSLPSRDSNILDLFFTTNPTLAQRVSILPGISDHCSNPSQYLCKKSFSETTVYIPIQEGKLGWILLDILRIFLMWPQMILPPNPIQKPLYTYQIHKCNPNNILPLLHLYANTSLSTRTTPRKPLFLMNSSSLF